MESINNITYYTLNEALLWLYVDAAKQRYGDVNSTYWENALITVNKIPPSMEKSYLKELLSRLSKPFVNFVPLTETESTFIKLLSDTFQASSNDSLFDKKPYIDSLPPPLGEGGFMQCRLFN